MKSFHQGYDNVNLFYVVSKVSAKISTKISRFEGSRYSDSLPIGK